MGASASPRWIANGNITPSRIVKQDTGDFQVIQAAAATDKPVGVAQAGTYDPPGVTGSGAFAATAGKPVQVFSEGEECLIEAGAAVTAGDFLKSDASGRGITVAFTLGAGTIFSVGFALESAAAAGVFIRMLVRAQALTNCTA